jgi:hypothetical protein
MISDIVSRSGGFSPRSIADLAIWLDAADAASLTLDESNNVSQWNDKSGNGRHATQTSATARPAYVASVLNGNPIVRIDGVDDLMQTDQFAPTVFYGASANQVTHIALLRHITATRMSLRIAASTTASTNRLVIDRQTASDGSSDLVIGTDAEVVITAAPLIGTEWMSSTIRWTSGTAPTLRYTNTSGTNTYAAPSALGGTMAGNQRVILGRGSLSAAASFELAEHLVYARALTDTEIASIEAYLLAKWGAI